MKIKGIFEHIMTDISLDSVTLAILKGRLEQIADEMDATSVSYTHLTLPTT